MCEYKDSLDVIATRDAIVLRSRRVGRVRTLKRALQSDGRPAYLRKSSFEVSMNTSGTPDTIEAVPKHCV